MASSLDVLKYCFFVQYQKSPSSRKGRGLCRAAPTKSKGFAPGESQAFDMRQMFRFAAEREIVPLSSHGSPAFL
jgi:hypothetical protein